MPLLPIFAQDEAPKRQNKSSSTAVGNTVFMVLVQCHAILPFAPYRRRADSTLAPIYGHGTDSRTLGGRPAYHIIPLAADGPDRRAGIGAGRCEQRPLHVRRPRARTFPGAGSEAIFTARSSR